MAEKHFTLHEAETLIPRLEQIIRSLIDNRKSALAIGEELSALQEKLRAGENIAASALVNKKTELDFLVEIIQEGLDAIEELGAQPKDMDIGLVDFPSMLDGEEVLLCWKYGEKNIRFYHGLFDGFSGRKPIPNM